ncbi:deoxynucleoside kinase, partial [Levilactobacillus parabrevis]|nr:deoxynucleoside kinase [Levilactobacillus parabrevis]
DYDISPKIKIDLQKYDLDKPGNTDIVLGQIDDALKGIRTDATV